jgi:hypothetical protein
MVETLSVACSGWTKHFCRRLTNVLAPNPIFPATAVSARLSSLAIFSLLLEPTVVTGFNDSISIERGPLVFSLPIGESWVKLRDRGMTADWQVFPNSQWNYALAPPTSDAAKISVEESPVGKSPFSLTEAPVKLKLEARKLPTWHAVDGVADPVPQSPVSSSEAVGTIKLVPYGAAKLRITAFPELKS